MPKSQFVSATRLKPIIVYCAIAFLLVLVADAAVQAFFPTRGVRQLVVITWIVGFPVGGWIVWRRT